MDRSEDSPISVSEIGVKFIAKTIMDADASGEVTQNRQIIKHMYDFRIQSLPCERSREACCRLFGERGRF